MAFAQRSRNSYGTLPQTCWRAKPPPSWMMPANTPVSSPPPSRDPPDGHGPRQPAPATHPVAGTERLPNTRAPQPIGKPRVGFTLIVPAGTAPAGGWPVAIFGPGFTRSKYDLFLAADLNAAHGIATMATDPAGHSFGPASVAVIHPGTLTTTFSAFGQGADLDGDRDIPAREGIAPTDHN